MWIKSEEDHNLPDWLSSNLNHRCAVCGAPMLNYYNDDGRCTNRKCSNEHCPGMLAKRADFVMKLIGEKGVGYKTFLNNAYGKKNHFQVIEATLSKPLKMTLPEFVRALCIEGVDRKLSQYVDASGITTLEELYARTDLPYELESNIDYVKECAEFVTIDVPFKLANRTRTVTVMITGGLNGFVSKEQFINSFNAQYGEIVRLVYQPTARKTGVDMLIKEKEAKTTNKVRIAMEAGIPIVTPGSLISSMEKILKEGVQ